MAKGFSVSETIGASPADVWTYLTDFRNAGTWMPGIDGMAPLDDQGLRVGAELAFKARGKERRTCVASLDPGRQIALKSVQGGVTAVYTYSVAPAGLDTEVKLDAACEASGLWKLIHPLILVAMRMADSPQLARLKAAIEQRA